MALDVALLQSSFELVATREPELTQRFYERLFAAHPEAREMFRDPAQQATMLRDALVAVVDHLEDAPWLAQTLGELGLRHVDYGVTAEMYDWVGAALLETLADIAGADWNDALHNAWADAFGAIVSLMHAPVAAE